jgi:hypothetical protein
VFSPIYIFLNSFSGYGLFKIDYCNGISSYTFQNVNGESGEILISGKERSKCLEKVMNEKDNGLLVENI